MGNYVARCLARFAFKWHTLAVHAGTHHKMPEVSGNSILRKLICKHCNTNHKHNHSSPKAIHKLNCVATKVEYTAKKRATHTVECPHATSKYARGSLFVFCEDHRPCPTSMGQAFTNADPTLQA